MKVQQRKPLNIVKFSSLKEGDTFRALEIESNPDIIWMKTKNVETDYDIYNAVDLSDGEMVPFENDEKVVPVTITVVEE